MCEVKVSVFCTAYNHEQYIAKALDSVVNQKTNFKFEVLVHDDASTDNTAKIIKEYALKYPDIIFPTFQTENQFSKDVKIVHKFLLPYAKGEYVAFLECDDYWSDENKLQTQVEKMEQTGIFVSSHYTEKRDEFNKVTGYYPTKVKNVTSYVLSKKEYFKMTFDLGLHLSSLVIKKSLYLQFVKNCAKFPKGIKSGDILLNTFLAQNTDVVFVAKVMSVYNQNSSSSYMASKRRSRALSVEHYRKMSIFYKTAYDNTIVDYEKDLLYQQYLICEYMYNVFSLNYKYIFAKGNREYFKKLNFKHRLKLRIGRRFPSFIEKRM